jgi:hypothetical protein
MVRRIIVSNIIFVVIINIVVLNFQLVSGWHYVRREDQAVSAVGRHVAYKPVPTYKNRDELPLILEREGFKIGAELGVQRGYYSKIVLSQWKSAEKYVLVDLWSQQEHYEDVANVVNSEQEANFIETQKQIAPWTDKIEVCRNYTTNCHQNYPHSFFDFVYVDARHDRLGVLQDLTDWWPKVKHSGLLCGHDYEEQWDGPATNNQHWDVNYDGTKDETGRVVRGAVDDFAANISRQVQVSYRENHWNTWCIRK